jgi:putative membrane protein
VTPETRLAVQTTVGAALAVVHAALTWSVVASATFAAVALALAFAAELVVVALGLLVHHTRPRVAGVSVWALLGWVGITYVSYRLVLVVVPAALAPPVAAVLATAVDVVVDPRGVESGLWSYPESSLSRPRYRGVPWWNFVGWLLLTSAVAWAAGRVT